MAKKTTVLKAVELLSSLLGERGLHVDHIILVGSQARRTHTGHSDLDLLVVSRDFEGRDIFERQALISGVHRKLVREIDIPVDLLLYSVTEWQNRTTLMSDVFHEEGVVMK